MRLAWETLTRNEADRLAGAWIEIEGWIAAEAGIETSHFALTEEPACCSDHLPRDPRARIEIFTDETLQPDGHAVRLAGRWTVLEDDAMGWRYQLHEARLLSAGRISPGFSRRAVLAGGAALGLSAWMPDASAAPSEAAIAAARQMLEQAITVDIHSHGGSFGGLKRIQEKMPFTPLAEPMRAGLMTVVCTAMVADTPTIKVTDDRRRIRPFRDPEPGELYAYAQDAFGRLHDLVKAQNLRIVADAAGLKASRPDQPSVIISAEGGDFLEGRTDRLDEAYEKWKLRHLQLTHYRVNELGDIQTEPPVHGGLTDAGAAIIRRCNERGVIVDVAHGTYDLVKRAASITTKPLVISHTSAIVQGRALTRMILPNHARLIAGTGGVIGIWPPTSIFANMDAYAAGIAEMVDHTSIDNVGIGTDMLGLLGGSALPSYRQLPELAAALLARGFKLDEMLKLLGGNYVRVALATLH